MLRVIPIAMYPTRVQNRQRIFQEIISDQVKRLVQILLVSYLPLKDWEPETHSFDLVRKIFFICKSEKCSVTRKRVRVVLKTVVANGKEIISGRQFGVLANDPQVFFLCLREPLHLKQSSRKISPDREVVR